MRDALTTKKKREKKGKREARTLAFQRTSCQPETLYDFGLGGKGGGGREGKEGKIPPN